MVVDKNQYDIMTEIKNGHWSFHTEEGVSVDDARAYVRIVDMDVLRMNFIVLRS